MTKQPNKPGGDFGESEAPRPAEDEQAVKNQGETAPDEYPDPARLDPEDRKRQ